METVGNFQAWVSGFGLPGKLRRETTHRSGRETGGREIKLDAGPSVPNLEAPTKLPIIRKGFRV